MLESLSPLKLTVALIVLIFAPSLAHACPFGAGGKYPRCDVLHPEPNEMVIVLGSEGSRQKPNPTNIKLGKPEKPAYLIDVKVLVGVRPLYVFVDAADYTNNGAIFRFTGAVDRISKVVAFGSLREGLSPVGIMGVDLSRIHFLKNIGDDPEYAAYCMGAPVSCRPWQQFKLGRREWDVIWKGFWKTSKTAEQIAAFELNDNRIPAYADIISEVAGTVTIPPLQPGTSYQERSTYENMSKIELDPSSIISPASVSINPSSPHRAIQ